MIKRKKKVVDKKEIEKQNKLFLEIWKERPHKSEVSGEKIYGECKTIYMHHILPKSKYPKFKFYKKNIIILTGDEHASVEMNMYKYPEINERRNKLLIEYYYAQNPEYQQIGLQNGDITVEQLIELNQL